MRRVVKKPEERRQEIVQAARHLFQIKDYEQATMQDVVDSVGIAKGTVYHYFKSKKELLEAVVEDIVNECHYAMQKVVEEATGTALEKFRLLMEKGNLAQEEPEILGQLHSPGNEAMHARLLAVAIAKQAPLYAKIIQEGCEAGAFQTDHPLECAEFFLAGGQFLLDVGIYPWSDDDLARRIRVIPQQIERLLGASSGSCAFMIDFLAGGQE